MKLALIGATGFVGSAALKELVSRGHNVTAIVRQAGTIEDSDNITPVTVDIMDTAPLAEALVGHDAVISAYNPGWANPNYVEDFARGSQSIQDATKQAGVNRLLVVGGAGSLYTKDGVQLVDTPDFPAELRPKAAAVRDYLNVLKNENDLDWTMISPAVEFGPTTPTERRGEYRLGDDEPVVDENGVSTISPADLAVAIVDEIESGTHHKARFTVGY